MSKPSLDQFQGLSQEQQQTITPQMQQRLQILQAPTLELQHLIQQEMLGNPVLEADLESASLEEEGIAHDAFDDEQFDREMETLSQIEEDWRDFLSQSRQHNPRSARDEERHAFLLDSLTVPETFQEHLLRQLGESEAAPEVREAVELLIGMVDGRGFLQSSIEDLSLSEGLPLPRLEAARDLLQSFDPVGVGSIDLQECLLLQLQRMGKDPSLESRIVRRHLEDLAMRRYSVIAKQLGVEPAQIAQAADFIATLNPHPGLAFSQDQNQYITADVVVRRDRGEYVIELTRQHIPLLRISNTYKDLMAESATSGEARRYLKDKIRSGKFFIRSVHQRQETIERIAREIVQHQLDFLDHGPSRLRPLKMAQVAETVGVHETTVSRAVSGKYMATPQGTFEMKYFFTTGYETEGGESLSNTSVKNALFELVRNEPPAKPYSDQKLVELLQAQGIPIARRTVAKYRNLLHILPSSMRRRS
ncbi:MAG TPA: RNA polymerase factor sigma-54 [Verrucomicrobiales bacterium]|nr:RNA polymerase factor sigma-54 [Verrucomicrobiales bacterium]